MDITKVLFLLVISTTTFAVNQKELQNWHSYVTDKEVNCPAPEETELKVIDNSLLLKIVDCGDPLAIYRYEFKVPTYTITQSSTNHWFFRPVFFHMDACMNFKKSRYRNMFCFFC